MTADLKKAAQIALLALEYHTHQTRPIAQTEDAIKVLMEALAAYKDPSPAEGDAEAAFEAWWYQNVADNSGASIGADYKHWARKAWQAAMTANVQPKGIADNFRGARRRDAAEATLQRLGYEWHGGELWAPPLGQAPAPAPEVAAAPRPFNAVKSFADSVLAMLDERIKAVDQAAHPFNDYFGDQPDTIVAAKAQAGELREVRTQVRILTDRALVELVKFRPAISAPAVTHGSDKIAAVHRSDETQSVDEAWEFWRPIICNDDGSLNMEQLKLELCDAANFMGFAASVYDYATGGQCTKVNTLPSVVKALIDDHVTEICQADEAGLIELAEALESERRGDQHYITRAAAALRRLAGEVSDVPVQHTPPACQACGGTSTHYVGSEHTDHPGPYCDACGPSPSQEVSP